MKDIKDIEDILQNVFFNPILWSIFFLINVLGSWTPRCWARPQRRSPSGWRTGSSRPHCQLTHVHARSEHIGVVSPAPLTAALVKVPSETWLAPVLVSAEIFLLSLLATAWWPEYLSSSSSFEHSFGSWPCLSQARGSFVGCGRYGHWALQGNNLESIDWLAKWDAGVHW